MQDLAVLWGVSDEVSLYSNISYYVKTGRLLKVHKGVYVLGEYTSFELGQKLLPPSYISFYTALAAHGIIFQLYEEKHYMALVSKRIKVNNETFVYHKLKAEIFFDQTGIVNEGNYLIAGPERAICDSLYLVPGLAFDSLFGVDKQKLSDVVKIYHNTRLQREVLCLTERDMNII